VDIRARLRRSTTPDRIFARVLDVAKKANLIGNKCIVDSTALYDAVATQDTVTLIRSAIVIVLREAESALEAELRGESRHSTTAHPGSNFASGELRGSRELGDLGRHPSRRDAEAALLSAPSAAPRWRGCAGSRGSRAKA